MNKVARILIFIAMGFCFGKVYSQWVDLVYVPYYFDPQLMKDLDIHNCEVKENRYSLYVKPYKENKPGWVNTSLLTIDEIGLVRTRKEKVSKGKYYIDTLNVWLNDSTCIASYDSVYVLNDSIYTFLQVGGAQVESRYSLSGRLEFRSHYLPFSRGWFLGSSTYHYTGNVLDSIVTKRTQNLQEHNYDEIHVFTYLPNGNLNESYVWYQYDGYRELSTVYLYEYGAKGLLSSIKVHYPHNPLDWHEYMFTWNVEDK